jgi:hypothetical protein
VLDHDDLPYKTFAAGARVVLSATELVAVAANMPSRASLTHLPSSMFERGAEFGAQVNCYNDALDFASLYSRGVSRSITPTVNAPICLLRITFAGWDPVADVLVQHRGFSTTTLVSIVVVPTKSLNVQRFVDFNVILLHLTSFLVLMAIPLKAVRFLALYCLGRLSSIYKRVSIEPFNAQVNTASAVMQCVANNIPFTHLADVPDPAFAGATGISRPRMRERLAHCFKHKSEVLDEEELTRFSNFCFDQITPLGIEKQRGKCPMLTGLMEELGGVQLSAANDPSHEDFGKLQVINTGTFSKICSVQAGVDFDDIISLFNRDRRVRFLERLFTPPMLYSTVHGSTHVVTRLCRCISRILCCGASPSSAPHKEPSSELGVTSSISVEAEKADQQQIIRGLLEKSEAANLANQQMMSTVESLRSEIGRLSEQCALLENKIKHFSLDQEHNVDKKNHNRDLEPRIVTVAPPVLDQDELAQRVNKAVDEAIIRVLPQMLADAFSRSLFDARLLQQAPQTAAETVSSNVKLEATSGSQQLKNDVASQAARDINVRLTDLEAKYRHVAEEQFRIGQVRRQELASRAKQDQPSRWQIA